MQSRDFEETAIIDTIATTKISTAIDPNSGTTTPLFISTCTDCLCSDERPWFAVIV